MSGDAPLGLVPSVPPQPGWKRRKRGRGLQMDEPETKITPYRNGPYLVRGPFAIVDQDGNEVESKRNVVALCRCGRSQIRPFCDGTHKAIGFRADSGPTVVVENTGVAAAETAKGGRRVTQPAPSVEDPSS